MNGWMKLHDTSPGLKHEDFIEAAADTWFETGGRVGFVRSGDWTPGEHERD